MQFRSKLIHRLVKRRYGIWRSIGATNNCNSYKHGTLSELHICRYFRVQRGHVFIAYYSDVIWAPWEPFSPLNQISFSNKLPLLKTSFL